jgi:molybdopterin/thiamine biosynthesis adenylyltransferase/nitroreductase
MITSTAAPAAHRFTAEMLLRNAGVLDDYDQAVLNGARVVIAGCGSVGGSVVEPLTRMGVGEMVFADPDAYDISNLNRQAAFLEDVGVSKALVQEQRAHAVNPFVRTAAYAEGVTAENVEAIVAGASIVFDAIDIADGGLRWKYLLHKVAARRRVPVVSAVDLAGQASVYVFDYRRDPTPFYGRASEEAWSRASDDDAEPGAGAKAVRGWLRITTMPADFLAMGRHVVASGISWPQVSYAVAGLGAVSTRVILEVLTDRPVRSRVSVDLHDLSRRRAARVAARLRWGTELIATARFLRGEVAGTAAAPPAGPPAHWREDLQVVAAAIGRAPSAGNVQPWRLTETADDALDLCLDDAICRPAGALTAELARQSLGCAIEAATTVADVTVERHDLPRPGAAVTLTVDGVRQVGYLHNVGVLATRRTNRLPFSDATPPPEVLAALADAAAARGIGLRIIDDEARRLELAAAVRAAGHGLAEHLIWPTAAARPFEAADAPDGRGLVVEGLGLTPRRRALARRASAPSLTALLARPRPLDWLIARSGAIVSLDGPGAEAWDDVQVGRALMAVWLAATRAGLAVHPIREPLADHRVRATAEQLFGDSGLGRCRLLVRVGYCPTPGPSSPRVPPAAFCATEPA